MAEKTEKNGDPDNPEWSEADFAGAKPFKDVFPEQFESWKRGRGRPALDDKPKVHVGFRLAADVVEKIKASGKGYNARVERVLRDAISRGQI